MMWYMHTIEYFSVIKRIRFTWMNFGNIRLSEIAQPQQDKCYMVHLHELSRTQANSQRYTIDSKLPGVGGMGKQGVIP